jgi:hypothetical protein
MRISLIYDESTNADQNLKKRYERVYHMGKLLLATELRSAKVYNIINTLYDESFHVY